MTIDPEEAAQRHAADARLRGDATGWFDELYREAATGATSAPWDRGAAHPLLVDWLDGDMPRDGDRTALVVGCGYGYDAAWLAQYGLDVTGFDISPTVVAEASLRVPEATFRTADLLEPPGEWSHAFDVVVEIMTVQSLPPELHQRAAAGVAGFVAPGGRLLIVGGVGREDVVPDGPPWPLTRAELDFFLVDGLENETIEQVGMPDNADVRRWSVVMTRSMIEQ